MQKVRETRTYGARRPLKDDVDTMAKEILRASSSSRSSREDHDPSTSVHQQQAKHPGNTAHLHIKGRPSSDSGLRSSKISLQVDQAGSSCTCTSVGSNQTPGPSKHVVSTLRVISAILVAGFSVRFDKMISTDKEEALNLNERYGAPDLLQGQSKQ